MTLSNIQNSQDDSPHGFDKERQIFEKNKKDANRLKDAPQSFFVKRYRLTFLVTLFIIMFGVFGTLHMPQEVNPEVKVPYGIVVTPYIGASPLDVEELVTKKLEAEIMQLDDLNSVTSTSRFGLSTINVEFDATADLDKSIDDLRRAVDDAKSKLPGDAEDPQVKALSFSNKPILEIAIFADRQLSDLQDYAENIQEELEKIPNVSSADIIGGLQREFHIVLDAQKLKQYGLSQDQIMGVITSSNLNFPVGTIEIDNLEYTLRVNNRFESVQDLLDLVVTYVDQKPLYLREVAEIKELYPEPDSFAYISMNGEPARQAINISLVKQTGGSIFEVVNEAKDVLQKYEAEKLPDDVSIEVVTDYSEYIEDSVSMLTQNGIQTVILVFVLLLLFLGFKEAFLAGISIPLTFLLALGFMNMFGATINSLTLFSLVLALGLLIDNAIVIVEGCSFYISTGKYSNYQAAILAVRDFKLPLLAGTLTTVAAFLPMLLTPGILGQFMKWIPLTISAVLLGSWFVALTLIPSYARLMMKRKKPPSEQQKSSKYQQMMHFKVLFWEKLEHGYGIILNKILHRKGLRRAVFYIVFGAFIAAMILPISGVLKAKMFPATDEDLLYLNATLPEGSSLEETNQIADEIDVVLMEDYPEIKNFLKSVGYDSGASGMAGSSGEYKNAASFTINLYTEEERKAKGQRSSIEIAQDLRDQMKRYTDTRVIVTETGGGPSSGAPIEVRIYGDDLDSLIDVTKDFEEILRDTPGASDVNSTYKETAGEFIIHVDKEKSQYFGVTTQQVARVLRTAVSGLKISDILSEGDEYDIVLKYKDSQVKSVSDLNSIYVMNQRGQQIPLVNVITSDLQSGVGNIRHNDEEKYYTISSHTELGVVAGDVTAAFEEKVKNYTFPKGVYYEIGGEREDIQESFTALFQSMFLAVFLIGMILILQFDSFVQPFIILFNVPLAMIGVMPGLFLMGYSISFPAFLGIVSLAGIVVNNGIILIDKMNINKRDFNDIHEAVVDACKSRIQPVILTTLTTFFGILPLALSDPFWAPMGIAIMFGIIAASFLTLFITPIMNYGVELLAQKRAVKKKQKHEAKLAQQKSNSMQ